MNFSFKSRFYLEGVVVVGALCGLVFLGWFLFGRIVAAAQEVNAAQKELIQLEGEQRQISEISKEYEEVKNSLPALDQLLLSREDRLPFIVQVERLAEEASVTHVIEAVAEQASATSLQKDKDAGGKIQPAVVFNINIFGDFSYALHFISLLENGYYYLTVEKLQISRAAGSGSFAGIKGVPPPGKDDVKMQVSVKVYTSLSR